MFTYYFLIIFLGTHRPGVCASADLAVLQARSPLPLARFSRQSVTFPRTEGTGKPVTPGVSGLKECSILEVEDAKW